MGFIEWHIGLFRRISQRNVNLVIIGKILVWFALGGILSDHLVLYSYYILLAAVVLLVSYFTTIIQNVYHDQKQKYGTFIEGMIGFMLVVFFLGMQSSHVPYRWHILGVGIILGIPALIDLLKGRKK